ncbi:formylglycine-generating enzyme family protein [Rheinheimera pacifica]|uniref:formylglycine-generating enzyme family protein n=1 Tax=Rheinheimera pacifica TaxID=173990 RepID=UPI002ED89306
MVVDFLFVELSGDPPEYLGLEKLTSYKPTYQLIKSLFSEIFGEINARYIDEFQDLELLTSSSEYQIIYLMGHGWLENGEYSVSIRNADGSSRQVLGEELKDCLTFGSVKNIVLLVDTCHAKALERNLQGVSSNLVAIYSSSADEQTYELPIEDVTRFSLSLSTAISCLFKESFIDPIEISVLAKVENRKEKIKISPNIDYSICGKCFRIPTIINSDEFKRHKSRTTRIMRMLLISGGVIFAVTSIFFIVLYWQLWLFEVEVNDSTADMKNAKLSFHREDVKNNSSKKIYSTKIKDRTLVRTYLLPGNYVVKLEGEFKDSEVRRLHYPVTTQATLNIIEKIVRWRLPDKEEINAHPGMSYVAASQWQRGRDLDTALAPQPFWIDIWPVDMKLFEPYVIKQLTHVDGPNKKSPLVHTLMQRRAMKNLGVSVESIRGLDELLEFLDREREPLRKVDPENNSTSLVNSFEIPCDSCPAIVSLEEAVDYCDSRNMKLPTRNEWEIAARGVDGRVYPWGDKFDRNRAYVVGLPEKGEKMELQPVDSYPSGASPWGVEDLIGNAGDWIDSEEGYETQFMGGHYRFDPDNSTVFSVLPVTNTFNYEITVRCVDRVN